MARARTRTKLPLDEWARIFGVDPLHFNQIVIQDAPSATCDRGWFQHPYQEADRVSRESVARAIRRAEDVLERWLGFRLVPTWETDEYHRLERPFRAEMFNLNGNDLRGFAAAVPARWGYFLSGGVRSSTVVDEGAVITYAEGDNDPTGYKGVATVSVAGLATSVAACDLHVYYPGKDGRPEWEIRPQLEAVNTAPGAWDLRFRREQAVIESLQEAYPSTSEFGPRAVTDDDANFLETVDVYLVENDPQQQATLLWEPLGLNCGCDGGCTTCAFAVQTACLNLRSEPRLAHLAMTPAAWSADDAAFTSASLANGRSPDMVRLWYRAGWRNLEADCPTLDMDPFWAEVVAALSCAFLDRPVCDCKAIQNAISRWQRDLAVLDEKQTFINFGLTKNDLDNPIGTKAGMVHAWKQIVYTRNEGAIGQAVL